MKDKLAIVKNHVVKHRFKYGVLVGSAATLAYLHSIAGDWHEFLDEQGVIEQYHASRDAA